MSRIATVLTFVLLASTLGAQQLPDETPEQLVTTPTLAAGIADETGWTALIARVGASNVPDGSTLVVGMAEANTPGYKPDANHAELLGKMFVLKSGASNNSGHATTVARHFFGFATSITPGISTIQCYSAAHFLGSGFLNGEGASFAPKTAGWGILNNSWIATASKTYLRKMDFAIGDQNLIVCSGVNNGTGPLDVPIFSHLFNGIAVGRSDGNHRAGGTLVGYDKAGRMKPELVAPASATSFATPLVSGAAALMRATATTHPGLLGDPNAARADLIKATLMAGATHRPGWANDAPTSGASRGLSTQPLDALYGADQIDVNRSHWILTGGEEAGAATVATAAPGRHAGWDTVVIPEGESRFWRFDVEAVKPTVSVLATWNRTLEPDFSAFHVPTLDLELWSVDAQGALTSLVGDPGLPIFGAGNVRSESVKDNLEHLYLQDLQPGTYALELTRATDGEGDWDVALAWDLACATPTVYGTPKTTSGGNSPTLSVRGFASSAGNDFDISVSSAEPNKNGVFFYGASAKSTPFFGGTLLVQGPVKRLPITTTDAQGAVTLPIAIDASMIGEQRNYQFWFRDPTHPDGTNVGLSNAVEIIFCP